MTTTTVAQGGSTTMTVTFYDRVDGTPVDDDRYASTGQLPLASILTPSGGMYPLSVSAAERLQQGTYRVTITAQTETTLTSALNNGDDWQARWSIQINGEAETFDYPVVVVDSGTATLGVPYYNSTVDKFRVGIAEKWEDLPQQDYAIGDTVRLHDDAVRVITIYRNGAKMQYGSEYTFSRPYTITFKIAVSAADQLVAQTATYFEDVEIETIAREVKVWIDSQLAMQYKLPFSETPPILKEIERQMVRGRLLLEFGPRPGTSAGKDDALNAKSWMKSARETLQSIVDGDFPLVLANGTKITPTYDVDTFWASITDSARGDDS